MRISERIGCTGLPCIDVNHGAYRIPDLDLDPASVTIVLISEAAPEDPADYYYAGGYPQTGALFEQTTVLAFRGHPHGARRRRWSVLVAGGTSMHPRHRSRLMSIRKVTG